MLLDFVNQVVVNVVQIRSLFNEFAKPFLLRINKETIFISYGVVYRKSVLQIASEVVCERIHIVGRIEEMSLPVNLGLIPAGRITGPQLPAIPHQ